MSFLDLLKSCIDNFDKICKYIPFGTLLAFVCIASWVIVVCNIDNAYAIIGIYSGVLFLSLIFKFIVSRYRRWRINRKLSDPKFLNKVWLGLCKEEQDIIVHLYTSDSMVKLSYKNKFVQSLMNRGMLTYNTQIVHPDFLDNLYIDFMLPQWVEDMARQNGDSN